MSKWEFFLIAVSTFLVAAGGFKFIFLYLLSRYSSVGHGDEYYFNKIDAALNLGFCGFVLLAFVVVGILSLLMCFEVIQPE